MKIEIGRFVQRCGSIPCWPPTCSQLQRAIQEPDTSLREVSSLVGKDPSLAARLLKLANSVYYGFPAQISTLEQAVQLIGTREIRDLLPVTEKIESFPGIPSRLLDVPSFWKHSIACAVASSLLAKEHNHPEPEQLFTAGLLHDLGRLVMLVQAPTESCLVLERCESAGLLAEPVEQDVFGFDHATLGGELLRSWNFPRSLVHTVRTHHRPGKSSLPIADSFLVHYADFLTTALGFGNSGESMVSPLVVPPGMHRYLLDDTALAALVEELEAQCDELFSFLSPEAVPVPEPAVAEATPIST